MEQLIAAANSPGGQRLRIFGGAIAVLVAARLKGPRRYMLGTAGVLVGGPALWGRCI